MADPAGAWCCCCWCVQAPADAAACAELHARFRALLRGLLEARLADALPGGGCCVDGVLAAVAAQAWQGQGCDDDELLLSVVDVGAFQQLMAAAAACQAGEQGIRPAADDALGGLLTVRAAVLHAEEAEDGEARPDLDASCLLVVKPAAAAAAAGRGGGGSKAGSPVRTRLRC